MTASSPPTLRDTYLLGYDMAGMVDVHASGLTSADKRTKACQQFRDSAIKSGGLAPGRWSELDFMVGCQDGLAGRPANVSIERRSLGS